jgi:hypothetical protein
MSNARAAAHNTMAKQASPISRILLFISLLLLLLFSALVEVLPYWQLFFKTSK